MKVKEAIEFCKSELYFDLKNFLPDYQLEYNNKMRDVISLLQRGEKYEAIVDELSRILPKPRYIYKNCNGKAFEYYCNVNAIEVLNSIKQKYFPKETIKEVVKGITEQIKEGAGIARKEAKQDYPEGEE